jgi:energy-converting hydrogenase Eha subunit B
MEHVMTRIVCAETPATHPGVERAEAAIERIRGLGGARGLAALLLAAIVSSLLIAADRLMAASQEGSLMAVWLVFWGVAFVGMALFAGTARALAFRMVAAARGHARRAAAARADREFMAVARRDPRILQELQVIRSHQECLEAGN